MRRKDLEYYVKWRDRAHIHCCWVPGARMELAAARSASHGVRPKLQAFERAQVHGEVRSARFATITDGSRPCCRPVIRILDVNDAWIHR